MDRAPILAEGAGSGAPRIHEIDRRLGPLRSLVIDIGRKLDIDWSLLEPVDRAASSTVEAATHTVDETLPPPPHGVRPPRTRLGLFWSAMGIER
jgi:hypothetical protein